MTLVCRLILEPGDLIAKLTLGMGSLPKGSALLIGFLAGLVQLLPAKPAQQGLRLLEGLGS